MFAEFSSIQRNPRTAWFRHRTGRIKYLINIYGMVNDMNVDIDRYSFFE